jgi:GTP cyclohydrolase IB
MYKLKNTETNSIPDVAIENRPEFNGLLDKVGMENVEIPILIRTSEAKLLNLPAKASFFINLVDPEAKGIHMSRLYLVATEILETEEFNFDSLKKLLRALLNSHMELSTNSFAEISFDYMLKQKALVSDKEGWRFYPVKLGGSLVKGVFSLNMKVELTYSSTCPCSAALSRKIIQEKFLEKFGKNKEIEIDEIYQWLSEEESQAAVPHSQRSSAEIEICFKETDFSFDIARFIKKLESVINTAVQAAVKREDEQEFARINAANFMFSEDSARRFQDFLSKENYIKDFIVKVRHFESLHPHDAVSIASKNSRKA